MQEKHLTQSKPSMLKTPQADTYFLQYPKRISNLEFSRG